MTISQADRLSAALAGRYRIERELGAGGMATVYLAFDEKHDRKVAIKVLKPELAAVLGAERFVVEIKTTAAMSHPHILPLFDSGTADGLLFYVMPYIQGETIREKLNRETQFGVDEAIRIAREVADALDYAHRHGVIHRDIKPENLLLHDGRAMVMDFGIALAVSAAAGGRMTETGLSLGTPHYMSPEQATAEKEITARSDQYSLASVLYEMLAGQPPHVGGAAQQVIMRIITEAARPVHDFRKNVPANVDAALGKALEKLPADRFENVKAFGDALANPVFATAATTAGFRAGSVGGVSQRTFLATAAFAGVAAIAALWALTRPEPPKLVTRVSIVLPDSQRLADGSARMRVALSPDGRTIAYVGGPSEEKVQLWVRRLDELRATPLVGTEGATNPSFSPDGSRLAYVSNASTRALRIVPVGGGPSITLTDSLVDIGGVSWAHDGYIYYDGTLDGIARVRETGGTPEVATLPDTANRETYHVNPSALPNGRGVLFSVAHGNTLDGFDIGVLDTRTGKHAIVAHGVAARYSPTGHLVYLTAAGAMIAVPFDASRLVVTGEAVPLAEGVAVRAITRAELEISRNGTLVYAAGGAIGSTTELVWVARDGSQVAVDSTFSGRFTTVRLSPDGRSAILPNVQGSKQSIVVKRLDRGPAAKVADDGSGAIWAADGKTILFNTRRGIERVPADGSRLPEVMLARAASTLTVSPDGKWLVYMQSGALYAIATGDTAPRLVVEGSSIRRPALSPDGRWLAYDSDAAGRPEVLVVPFPDATVARYQVTTSGGLAARWSRDGKTLFFIDDRTRDQFSVPVTPGPTFVAGSPRREFSTLGLAPGPDQAADGRFLSLRYADARTRFDRNELILVVNFAEELKAKARRK